MTQGRAGEDDQQAGSNSRGDVVLVLGGGGARGLAHFGAVEAIIDSGFQIKRIYGVSVGGLAGAMFAAGESALEVKQRILSYVKSAEFLEQQDELFGASDETAAVISSLVTGYGSFQLDPDSDCLLGRVLREPSLLPSHSLEQVIVSLLPDIEISETKIPLSLLTIDLKSGLPIVLEQGSLRRAVLASTALPGFFPPIEWGQMLLADLGLVDSLPTHLAKRDTTGLMIGVDVGPDLNSVQSCPTALHALLRMDEISERMFRRVTTGNADILIRPPVGHHPWYDFSSGDRLARIGYRAAKRAIAKFERHQETD